MAKIANKDGKAPIEKHAKATRRLARLWKLSLGSGTVTTLTALIRSGTSHKLLGRSCVVRSRASRVVSWTTTAVTHIIGLRTPHAIAHESPSKPHDPLNAVHVGV